MKENIRKKNVFIKMIIINKWVLLDVLMFLFLLVFLMENVDFVFGVIFVEIVKELNNGEKFLLFCILFGWVFLLNVYLLKNIFVEMILEIL